MINNITLARAEYIDKDKISKFLIENHGHKETQDVWRKLFLHEWSDKNYYGYCLKNENMEIVGYFGLIFTKFNKYENYGYANITSWCVKKNYRKYSLKLLTAAMQENDYILTSHTTTENTHKHTHEGWNWKVERYRCCFPQFSHDHCKHTQTHS